MTAEPVWDPLGRRAELPLEGVFFPLGFRLNIRTNSPAILEAAAEAFPETEALDVEAPPAFLEVIVAAEGPTADRPPQHRARGEQVVLALDANHCGLIDVGGNRIALWLADATLRDAERVRRDWLEGPVFTLLSERWLVPIHASCVESQGRGVLLCGPSGAGKSTLALTLARQGWHFVTDDVAYLLRSDPSVLLGRSRRVRLKRACAVQMADPEELGLRSSWRTTPAALIFLDRGPGRMSRTPIDPAEALRQLALTLPYCEARQEQLAALESLKQLPIFRLRYQEAEAAVGLVEQALGRSD